MADHPDTAMDQERRRYFRIDDRIGLRVRLIDAADEAAVTAAFDSVSARFGLINQIRAIRDESLPQRRQLHNKFPTVAAYVSMLEQQIECLALALNDRESAPRQPDTQVDLSAQGLGFRSSEHYPVGALLEVCLTLFPDSSRVMALARVITAGADGRTAVEFCELREADREAIIRHVHALQFKRLQVDAHAQPDARG